MAQFTNNAITDAGRALLAMAQVGGELDPTRIVMGSGYMPAGYTAATMVDVVMPVISLAINKKERTPDGKAIFGGYYSNKDVSTAFEFRELAIYSRIRYAQPDGSYVYSDEVLYSYGNAGVSADYMPAYSTNTVVERQMDIVVWIGNETAINLSIEGGVYVTHAEMNKAIAESESRLNEKIDGIEFRFNRDLFVIGARLDDAEARIGNVEAETVTLNANAVAMHSRLNEVSAQASSAFEAIFTAITENPAIVDFDTLDGITLTGGVWNAPLRRLEV